MEHRFELHPPEYQPRHDHIRVATAMPEVAIADVETNTNRIIDLYNQASDQDVALVVFPELSITGYTLQDLVRQPQLLSDAKTALAYIAECSRATNTATVIGLPLQVGNALYNTAALVADGEIKGIVPKQHLPTYDEFYEKRWYQTWDERDNTQVQIGEQSVVFGRKQLFTIAGHSVGIEICEDVWVANQPSIELAGHGATLIANPSASPEKAAKSAYRRDLIGTTAARIMVGYLYAGADSSESTADIVMSGHSIISEMGHTRAEQPALAAYPKRLLVADLDMQHITTERAKYGNYQNNVEITSTPTTVTAQQNELLTPVDAHPFVPKGNRLDVAERLDAILNIQAVGLARKLISMPQPDIILGLSGGLDSTLALLVAERAARYLGIPASEIIHTLTMLGEASSDRTQSNAVRLAASLSVSNEELPISELAAAQLRTLQHNGSQDVTYENTQARIRTDLIFNRANQIGALALGTGDLSEIALGWCTYGGDQLSGYNPNSSIPKTLVRSLVEHAAESLDEQSRAIIHDILDTPVSPELTGDGASVSQKTEDLIGPYELHDFFLWHFVRWLEPERKIGYMAMQAFGDTYSEQEVYRNLDAFMTRFYRNQWKRQASPDGAKVGISLNPRGDWRMSPEASRAQHDIRAQQARAALEQAGVL